MLRRNYSLKFMILAVLLMPLAGAAEDAAVQPDFISKVLSMLENGGSLMWVMLLTSVIGLTYASERLISLRLKNYIRPGFNTEIDVLLATATIAELKTFLITEKTLLARTFSGILNRIDGTREEMERGIDDDLSRALWDERKNIKPVGLVASIAPLLGLLGTVIGMIDAFRQASENGMNDPAIFAGGIYQALYTTAFGLVLAIPFFVLYNYLKTKSEFIMRKIEDESLIFVDKVKCSTIKTNAEEERSEAA